MGTITGTCVVVIGILIVGVCGTAHFSVDHAEAGSKKTYVNHNSILIKDKNGFTFDKGVSKGNGSKSDPYIIEGWYIDDVRKNAIEIRDSSVHFVIRNVWLQVGSDHHGLYLDNVTNGTVESSVIDASSTGIMLKSTLNVTIRNNTISQNNIGVNLTNSGGCMIYGNVFYNNAIQLSIDKAEDHTNDLNMSYPVGGNYWSDYEGVDNFLGEEQNLRGMDGIGDEPYAITGDLMDHYPLITEGPFKPPPSLEDEERTIMDAIVENYWISQMFVIGFAICGMIYLGNKGLVEDPKTEPPPAEKTITIHGMELRTAHGFSIHKMPPIRLEYS